jgi:hypothetical protein
MYKSLNIGKLHIGFVFKHRFKTEKDILERYTWRGWRIGLWYKKERMVGRKNFRKPREWSNNLVNSHMIGIELLIFKSLVTIDYNGMHIKIED